ncbi:SPW repeat domain-containing protein [Tautonia plasticadhaerens]|uniref:SPW repeat protein n=1 Tax=Tautonia plasticadhaerens TaxID=2527974 RepID=A0A518GXP2_9BACT|nr:SPW repeat protein [Tautonia plasticadhaerens]QDV33322.1 SPW repeat protein [Tautonia plasticadhaerens]
MRIIPTRIHGVIDYLMGVVLIAAPWVLGFAAGGAETWVPVIIGAGAIVYAMLTNFELGVVGLISMPAHLAIDAVAGVFLAVSPWLFGFAEYVWIPHVVVGLLALGAAAMTQTVPTRTPAGRGRASI